MNQEKQKIFKDLPLFQETPVMDEAIETYQRGTEKDPNNPFYYYKMGRALQSKGKKLAALEAFQKALKINRSYYPARYGLGLLYSSIGKYKAAIREYNKALRISPEFLEAMFNLALCYEYSGAYESAAKVWKTYCEKETNPVWAREAQTHLERCQGRQN